MLAVRLVLGAALAVAACEPPAVPAAGAFLGDHAVDADVAATDGKATAPDGKLPTDSTPAADVAPTSETQPSNCKALSLSCPDGVCQVECGETAANCACDCPIPKVANGDGKCEPCENINWSIDCCICGDGKCVNKGVCGEAVECAKDCQPACGNKVCEPGETPQSCNEDCDNKACGNGQCEAPKENPQSCPTDCATGCGNCLCEAGETAAACPKDCGACGDGVCSICPDYNESGGVCTTDCKD
ncbi:MAG: hypothetical protein FJ100_10515 [Deltaproteobacteria bacterium]|nr:hypothetical protein [Deltaproteobacteria bacterium]